MARRYMGEGYLDMVRNMDRLTVTTHDGEYLSPVFEYDWESVVAYVPRSDALEYNTTAWLTDKGKGEVR